MEDKSSMLLNVVLNDTRHLKRYHDKQSPFKPFKKSVKPGNT